jgi:hypothetical protein
MILRMKLKAWLAGLLSVLALSVVAVAGCGGSDDSAAAAEPLTKAQFIKRATAVCQKEQEVKARKLEGVLTPELTKEKNFERKLEEIAAEVAIPLYEELIAELSSLEPPAQDKARIRKVISSYEAALKQTEANPAVLLSKNSPFRTPADAAGEYGIENCIL